MRGSTERIRRRLISVAPNYLGTTDEARASDRAMLEALLQGTETPIAIADPQGQIIKINALCAQRMDLDRSDAVGLPLWALAAAEDRARMRTAFELARDEGRAARLETTWPHQDEAGGSVAWSLSATHDRLGQVSYVVATGADLTAQRQLERRVAETRAELARVVRVHTLGEMAASLAHELSQALTSIGMFAHGCLSILRRPSPQLPEVSAAVERVIGQSDRATRIIRRITDMSRKAEIQRLPVDLNEIVCDLVDFAANDCAFRKLRVTLDLESGLPPVRADRIELEQVILNLLRNALEATHRAQGPGVTISTRLQPGGAVELAVRDAGDGIAPDMKDKIFEAFVTTKRDGLGMGLSICRAIVSELGGRLTAANNPDRGATFLCVLPATTEG